MSLPLLLAAAATAPMAFSGTMSINKIGDLPVTNGLPVIIQSATPIRSTGIEPSHIFKYSAGVLYHYEITNTGGFPAYALIIDANTVPKAGTTISPVHCQIVAPNQTISFNATMLAESYKTGIVALLSSAGVCYSYTPYSAGFFEGVIQ